MKRKHVSDRTCQAVTSCAHVQIFPYLQICKIFFFSSRRVKPQGICSQPPEFPDVVVRHRMRSWCACSIPSNVPPQPSFRTQNSRDRKSPTHLVLAVTVASRGTTGHFECWKLGGLHFLRTGDSWVSVGVEGPKGKRRKCLAGHGIV